MTVYAGRDGPWTNADRRNAAQHARGSILLFCHDKNIDPDKLEFIVSLDEERIPNIDVGVYGPDGAFHTLCHEDSLLMKSTLLPQIRAAYPDTIFRAGDGEVRIIERIAMREISRHEKIEALAAARLEAAPDASDPA